MNKKELILSKIKYLVNDFLFYDRITDEELSTEDIENATKDGSVTIEEMTEKFKEGLIENGLNEYNNTKCPHGHSDWNDCPDCGH
jgi:hypothetical protein